MTIFELMGKIVIENNQANKAIDDTTSKAQGLADSLGGSGSGGVAGMAQSMGSKVANVAGKVGTTVANAAKVVGKTVLAGTATAAAGITALTKQAVSAYADHEQLVGGVETLFKDSADTVKGYADEAFQTAGLSANEYLKTVTSFSASLLQSLNGNTAQAADMANQAIIDMSDNANKMGTDISMIQNAYNGFAKQNYTMLDNLKLGYGGTKSEMERLLEDANKINEEQGIQTDYQLENFADITEAIHVVQNEMDITGTTAKEASTTISGSWGSLKSSFQNLLVGFASEDADLGGLMGNLGDSAGTFASNLIPRIVEAFGGIKDAIPELAESLAPALSEGLSGALEMVGINIEPEKITNFFSTAFEKVGDIGEALGGAGGKVGTALKNAFTDIFDSLGEEGIEVDGLVDGLFDGITNAIEKGGDWAAGIVETLGGMIADNMPAILNIGENLKGIGQPIFDRLKTEFDEIDWEGAFKGTTAIVEGITGAFNDFMNADSETAMGKIRDFLLDVAALPVDTINGVATGVENLGAAFKVAQEIDTGKINFTGALKEMAAQLAAGETDLSSAADSLKAQVENCLAEVDLGTPSFRSAIAGAVAAAAEIKAKFSNMLSEVQTAIHDIFVPSNAEEGGGGSGRSGSFGNSGSGSITKKGGSHSDKVLTKKSTDSNSIDDPYGVMNLNADGAIYSKATIFGRANGKLQVAGEAGAEAVAPIDVLQGYVSSAVAEQVGAPQAAVVESIAIMTETMNAGFDRMIEALNNVGLRVNNREFARLVAGTGGMY